MNITENKIRQLVIVLLSITITTALYVNDSLLHAVLLVLVPTLMIAFMVSLIIAIVYFFKWLIGDISFKDWYN